MTRWRAGQKQAENLTYSESPNGSLVVVAVESSCASNAKGPPATCDSFAKGSISQPLSQRRNANHTSSFLSWGKNVLHPFLKLKRSICGFGSKGFMKMSSLQSHPFSRQQFYALRMLIHPEPASHGEHKAWKRCTAFHLNQDGAAGANSQASGSFKPPRVVEDRNDEW